MCWTGNAAWVSNWSSAEASRRADRKGHIGETTYCVVGTRLHGADPGGDRAKVTKPFRRVSVNLVLLPPSVISHSLVQGELEAATMQSNQRQPQHSTYGAFGVGTGHLIEESSARATPIVLCRYACRLISATRYIDA